MKNLAEGGYILKETAAPTGYIISTDIYFSVFSDGSVKVDNVDSQAKSESGNPLIVMIDDTTKVRISKQDITTKSELTGAKLQVIKDGNVIEEWISGDKPHFIEAKLTANEKYILREITAPNGYAKAVDIEFSVNSDGSVTEVVMYDQPLRKITVPKAPKTSDSGKNALGWLFISLAIAATAGTYFSFC